MRGIGMAIWLSLEPSLPSKHKHIGIIYICGIISAWQSKGV
jgi:hypothetical protein